MIVESREFINSFNKRRSPWNPAPIACDREVADRIEIYPLLSRNSPLAVDQNQEVKSQNPGAE